MEKRNDDALDVLREEMHEQKIVAVRTAAKALALAEEARPTRHAPHREEAAAPPRAREERRSGSRLLERPRSGPTPAAEVEGYFDGLDDAEPMQCSNDLDVPLPYC